MNAFPLDNKVMQAYIIFNKKNEAALKGGKISCRLMNIIVRNAGSLNIFRA